MSDIPLELNPFLGAAPPAASSAPIANVAIERRFRDHLNQIQSRPSDQSPVSDSDHASSESPAPASEGNSFDSKHTTQDAHSSDAANNGPKKDAPNDPSEVAGAGSGAGTDEVAYANAPSFSNRASNEDAVQTSRESLRAKAAGKPHVTTKPTHENQKPAKLHGAAPKEKAEKVNAPSLPTDSNADGAEIQQADELQSISRIETPDLHSNVDTRDTQGLESSVDSAEEVAERRRDGEATGQDALELTQLNDNATPATRRARGIEAKHESGVHTPTSIEAVSAVTESSPPETTLTTETVVTATVLGNGDDKDHDLPPPSDTSRKNPVSRDDRTITAPALLSSQQDDLRRTTSQRDDLSDVDRVRLVERVARSFRSIGEDGGKMQLRLRPPELGSLRLEIAVRDGVMTAHLETETAAARNVLLDNLPQLRDRLAQQNVKVERFDVNVRDEAQQRNDQAYEGQPNLPRAPRRGPRALDPAARPVPASQGIAPRNGHSEGSDKLNVVI
jgi:flagellar hook-length control protein FliK